LYCIRLSFGLLLLGFFTFKVGMGFAQIGEPVIDYSRIKQKKVRQLIHQKTDSIDHLSSLEVSVQEESKLEDFIEYNKVYEVKLNADEVWYNYRNSSQTDIWDISKISFGLIYCRESDALVYADQMLMGLESNRIYFINLKILNGFYNLPVAFEITRIDPESRTIEFSYLRGGKAKGKQIIQISDTEDGITQITHQSFVKSNSKFRDKYLYPYFHNKLINEFHMNMKRMIASRAKKRQELVTMKK